VHPQKVFRLVRFQKHYVQDFLYTLVIYILLSLSTAILIALLFTAAAGRARNDLKYPMLSFFYV
jgi:hypothetical protein